VHPLQCIHGFMCPGWDFADSWFSSLGQIEVDRIVKERVFGRSEMPIARGPWITDSKLDHKSFRVGRSRVRQRRSLLRSMPLVEGSTTKPFRN
jgi:hypothetical protein